MPEERNHDHYIFQDLDLLNNKIKEIKEISSASNEDLILGAGKDESNGNFNKKIQVQSETQFNQNVNIGQTVSSDLIRNLEVSGTSTLAGNTTIGSGDSGKRDKTLTISGVEIRWDTDSQSLVFINKGN